MADTASIHREMFDTIKRRDFAHLRELYHPDYRYFASDGTTGGADAGIEVAETYITAFPDMDFEVRHELSCEPDTSILELTVRGTHQGELEGVPPTGRSIEVALCNVVEVRDGKIYREREYFDQLTMLRQLGVAD